MENEFATSEQRQAKQLDELNDLRNRQIAAAQGDTDAIKMISANKDSKIKIKETDKDYVHVALMTRTLDANQKEFLTDSKIVKVHPNNFAQIVASNAYGAYDDVKVIHDPRPNAPKEYNLKPFEPKSAAALVAPVVSDAAQAAREQKNKESEARIDKKIAELSALLAQSNLAAKTPVKQQPAKAVVPPLAPLQPAPPVIGEQVNDDLPPLNV